MKVMAALILALVVVLLTPLTAEAQRAEKPVIGFLHFGSPGPFAFQADAFRQGLSETGYVERQNVAIEYRWAENVIDRLPSLAAELVGRRVDVIAAFGPPPLARPRMRPRRSRSPSQLAPTRSRRA